MQVQILPGVPSFGEKVRTSLSNVNRGQRCDVYIGRGTPFGNPYAIGQDGDRDEVIRKYRIHFQEKLQIDKKFKGQVEALRGKTLGCHCSPLGCHGDVIVEYLDGPLPPPKPPATQTPR